MPSTPALQLERVRRHNGVSLEEIAEKTKISTRFLRAIETGEFEKLPGGVFDINYIRQYAAGIGFDADTVLEQYTAFVAIRNQEFAEAEAKIAKTRMPWSRRCLAWLRGTTPATRASDGV
jgi:cytoskeletal protein RodZ